MERLSKKSWLALTKAAESGHAEAQWEIGLYFESGAATKSGKVLASSSREEALRWYKRAAKQGYAAAMTSLSNLLSSGNKPDYPLAITWAKAAIALGDASAAFNLGVIYRDLGKPAQAFRCYQLAAGMGDAESLLQIGLCQLLGHGTKPDLDAALDSIQKVLDAPREAISPRGREDALYWLGLLNLMGLTQRRSAAVAKKLLEQANADGDHEPANSLLNVIGRPTKTRLR